MSSSIYKESKWAPVCSIYVHYGPEMFIANLALLIYIVISCHFMLTRVLPSVSSRAAEKAEAQADAEEGKKKKGGGVQVPDEWPWEEAKKVFEQPDVTPAAELQVSFTGHCLGFGFIVIIFSFD